ncbi:MAG TPA: aromatic ring-hydroxylating dioxygenase subunit alpha [Acidimicrobiales bacterium]|nr:aromatic ring-hydroxylating dioxygenase subunit alpha [Acidimicrobiales bacterium]
MTDGADRRVETAADRRRPIPSGARVVQALLDADTRRVPGALRQLGDAELSTAHVPRSRYTSRDFHDAEVEMLWPRVWQMVCREEQVPEVGDSIVYDIVGTSLVVVRTAPDEIRAFRNSCLHRGTALRSQPGHIESLRCPFHGFTWNLDGSFAGMPCSWDFPHIDATRFCLPEARVGQWGGFVFVRLGDGGEALEDYLEILPAHFRSWPLEERVLIAHVVRVVPCNWKVALEAFIESYHTVAVHPQLLTTSGDAQTQYDVYRGVHHVNRMITPVGVASDHVDHPVEEQDIVDAMFMTKDGMPLAVADGSTARAVLADRVRAVLAERTGRDYSALSDTEALDAIEYFVFPNFVPWAGYTTPLVYRFRPNGDDHRSSIMDVMLLDPLPLTGPRPQAARTRHLGDGERWADAPELGYLGRILDQDTATLGRVQRGLEAVSGPGLILASYQECRIRHFHETLGRYVSVSP